MSAHGSEYVVIKTEQETGAYSQDDDMMMLEISSEKIIKQLQKALDSIANYKAILPYVHEYNVKKEYFSLLMDTKDVLSVNKINDLKTKIVTIATRDEILVR